AEKRKRRRLRQVVAGLLGVILLGAVGFAWWFERHDKRERLRQAEYEADQARSEGERKAIEAQAAADLQASEARAEGERKVLKAAAEKQAAELRAADAERKQLKADAVARAAELKAAGAARTEQEKQIRQGVPAALRLASGLRKAYQFTDAGEVLDQAEKLAGGGLTPDLVPIVKQAKDDLAFARELDEIRMRKALWIADQDGGGRFDTRSAPPPYNKAFLDP